MSEMDALRGCSRQNGLPRRHHGRRQPNASNQSEVPLLQSTPTAVISGRATTAHPGLLPLPHSRHIHLILSLALSAIVKLNALLSAQSGALGKAVDRVCVHLRCAGLRNE